MKFRKIALAAVTVVAVSALAGGGYFLYKSRAQERIEAQTKKTIEDFQKRQRELAVEQAKEQDVYRKQALDSIQAPAPLSTWLENEKNFFAGVLDASQAKVLVVPLTTPPDAPGIDITGRITIAREIAAQIEPEVGPIPDPGLVFRALGEPRSMSLDEIRHRLEMVRSVEWLVVGSAEHDGKGKMRISLTKVQRDKQQPVVPGATFDKAGIEIGGALLPELQFAQFATEAARGLGFKGRELPAGAITKASALAFPKSPSEAPKSDDSTLGGVWTQQLLGVLYAPYYQVLPRPQERVFERTLAALIVGPSQAPDHAVLMARALAYLDRREAALKVLAAGAATPEEKALAAYLNADLPALRAAVTQVKRPIARLMSEIELLVLRKAFDDLTQEEAVSSLKSLAKSIPQAWQPLLAFHVLSLDVWTTPSSVNVKPVLDHEFPVAGYSLEDILKSKSALGARGLDEKGQVELLLSPLTHVRRWRDANTKELCCMSSVATWANYRPSDYLDLLEADAERLTIQKLEYLQNVQGLPDQAQRLADLYDQVLFGGGHPGVIFERLNFNNDAVRKATGDESGRLALEAFELSRKLLTWQSTQSAATGAAVYMRNTRYNNFLLSRGPLKMGIALPPHPMELEFPKRVRWTTAAIGSMFSDLDRARQTAREACINTVFQFENCKDYVELLQSTGHKTEVGQVVKELIEPRFNGNIQRIEFLASASKEAGDSDAARQYLQEAVRAPRAPMAAYGTLGQFLQEEGDFAAAAATYLSYPGLKDPKANPVEISNYAGGAGFGLARLGAIKEARPLIARAASNRDGSEASMLSTGRLAMLDGDYATSLAVYQQVYQRYPNPVSVRTIASMLFMLGEKDVAWSALRDVLPASREFSPYRAVPVGMRIGAYDENAMLNWRHEAVTKMISMNSGGVVLDFIDDALFQALLVDRSAIAADKLFHMKSPMLLLNFPPQPPGSIAKAEAAGWAVSRVVEMWIAGYTAFKKRDHNAAALAWGELVKDFDPVSMPSGFGGYTGDSFWAAMPYFAVSLAKTGRSAEAKQLPVRLTKEGRPAGSPKISEGMAQVPMPAYDRKMIAGIVEAFAGNHAQALRLLRSAQGSMATPGTRLIPPDYAFAEILESLSAETGERAYLQMALDFAKTFKQYEPWAAWAYAFEASHLPAGPDQVRAAAAALRLDPKSSRLNMLDAKVLEQARQELARNDPFRLKPPAKLSGT